MKTAISLPDRLFEEADKTAQYMGLPRSQLFAIAIEEFLENHSHDRITEALNNVFSDKGDNDFVHISNSGLESLRELTKDDSW